MTCSARRARGIKHGYKSGLEETIAQQFLQRGLPDQYEKHTLHYVDPKVHRYRVDFILPSGVYVESKGRFMPADRAKHLLVKQQHPDVEIRFVFQNPKARLSKTSETTYAQWCDKHGFKWAAKVIPDEWFKGTPD